MASHKNQNGEIIERIHRKILDVIRSRKYEQIDQVITESVDTWSILQPEE